MKRSRVGRREFVRGIAGSAAAIAALPAPGFGTPLPRQTAPKIKFGVIGINHGHINSQVEAVIRGGGELVSMFAKEPDLTAAFVKRFPQAKVARSESEVLEDKIDSARRERGHPRRARAARHPRHEARQGLHGRQAGHHDARAARRGAQGAGRDEAHLLDHVQRAAREPRDGQGGRAGAGRRDRPGRADDRARAAPDERQDASGVVLRDGRATAASSATSRRTRPTSSCSSPARRRPRSWPRRSATSTIRSIPGSRTSAT